MISFMKLSNPAFIPLPHIDMLSSKLFTTLDRVNCTMCLLSAAGSRRDVLQVQGGANGGSV